MIPPSLRRLGGVLGWWRFSHGGGGIEQPVSVSPDTDSGADPGVGWEAILDRLPTVFLSLDAEWRITHLNETSRHQICAMLNEEHSKDDLVGKQFWELHTVDPSGTKLYQSCHEAMEIQEMVAHVEYYEEGDGRWVHTQVFPSPSGVSIFSRDITERKERERELERKNERLDEFATIVSHDLRNPLNVAEGYLDLALEESDSEYLAHVEQALDRMSVMIGELLELARGGGRDGDATWIELRPFVEDCWHNLETKSAALEVVENRIIYADRNQLTQLFENLFRNVAEHAGTGAAVTVGPMCGGFYVEDDGPGIPPDRRDTVFESGYSTSAEGTGFGLRIVTELVDAHGWEVRVTESDAGGARFEFTGVVDAAIGGAPDPNIFSATRSQTGGPSGTPTDDDASDDTGGYSDLVHLVEITTADDADYFLEVSEDGHLFPVAESSDGDRQASIDRTRHWVDRAGSRAAGRVTADERHAYRFDGDLRDVSVEGPATVTVDGVPAQLDRFPHPSASDDDWKGGFPWQDGEGEHIYEFCAADADTYSDYYIEIEDGSALVPVAESEIDATAEPAFAQRFYWISEDGRRAAGRVYPGEHHAYRFDTMLCDVTVDGPAAVYVDGSRSHLDRYPLPAATGDDWKGGFDWQGRHCFEFRADDATAATEYYLEVEEGPTLAVPENGAEVDPVRQWVSRDGTLAAGRLLPGDRHAYRFDADICDVTVDGEAGVFVNGVPSSLDWFPQGCARGDGWKGGFPWQDAD